MITKAVRKEASTCKTCHRKANLIVCNPLHKRPIQLCYVCAGKQYAWGGLKRRVQTNAKMTA